MERNPKVLSVATFMVHIWIDALEVGWSCIVVTDNDPALAQQLCDELSEMNWAVKIILILCPYHLKLQYKR